MEGSFSTLKEVASSASSLLLMKVCHFSVKLMNDVGDKNFADFLQSNIQQKNEPLFSVKRLNI